ncbi:MAG: exo-alpha-sialidase [candidate division KSB1 bacterium]|nr:exo-alpha-sialidase [candidate division KSB1 bacterium]
MRASIALPLAVHLLFAQIEPGAGQLPPRQAEAPVQYVGNARPDPYFYDGRLPHAVGVHHFQAFRANRRFPPEGGSLGYTYNHQPYLAYWNGKFYLQFLSGGFQEHTPPTRTMIAVSADGRNWQKPVVAFPEYPLPEIHYAGYTIPAGTGAVMHQRMGFYVAPNGRLLTLAFYSFCPTPRFSPNKGQGIGRVVREIYADGSMGPIYFIRYNRQNGWNEKNTRYPYYKSSPDKGFVEACEALLADKLMILQWWEEDRQTDGFFPIDPSKAPGIDPASQKIGVTTAAGAGKAFCFFRRGDGMTVGIWKNAYFAVSPDSGRTWSPIVKMQHNIRSPGSKIWGQRTEDGRYVLVYNFSATLRNRFPLVMITSDDGRRFDRALVVQGEVPPMRYQGIHKNPGSQYVRGILPGNGDPPGKDMWLTYSMNKEDIWVARVPVPVTGSVPEHVNQDFSRVRSIADLKLWNLYMPKWAPIRLVGEPNGANVALELLDEDPVDYARAERIFPSSKKVTLAFKVRLQEMPRGYAFFVEVQSQHGHRPVALRFDRDWLSFDHRRVKYPHPVRLQPGQWIAVRLVLDCEKQQYRVFVNGEPLPEPVPFAEETPVLERVVFRTGPWRGEVPKWLAEEAEPKTAGLYREDRAGSDQKTAPIRVWIDDVRTHANR